MGRVKNRGKKLAHTFCEKMSPYLKGNNYYCQNEDCPNDYEIKVAIFRGTGYCSDNCKKALGLDGATHGAR